MLAIFVADVCYSFADVKFEPSNVILMFLLKVLVPVQQFCAEILFISFKLYLNWLIANVYFNHFFHVNIYQIVMRYRYT